MSLAEKERQLAARWREIGGIDAASIERARNKGASRTESKREMLAVLEEKARQRGGRPAFPAYY